MSLLWSTYVSTVYQGAEILFFDPYTRCVQPCTKVTIGKIHAWVGTAATLYRTLYTWGAPDNKCTHCLLHK